MFIKNINLSGYRNYHDNSFIFSPNGCILVGKNGVGKTNLLEAITYFAYGKSINNHSDKLIKGFYDPFFLIQANYQHENIDYLFEASFQNEKIIKINDTMIKRQSDLYSYLQIVYFSPDDIHLIIGSPKNRRRFLDMSIAKLFTPYIELQKTYHHVLNQRNQLLKNEINTTLKKVWDEQFLESSKEILNQRIKFLAQFESLFQESYHQISSNQEFVSINYIIDDHVSIQNHQYENLLKKYEEKEIRYQRSLFGSHTEDFHICLNNKNANQFASQGQKRSIVIALKLALAKMIYSSTNIYPILLFDDTLAELDKYRSENLLHNLSHNHQIFIASPNIGHYNLLSLPVLEL